MEKVIIALGSNMGDRIDYLRRAIELIHIRCGNVLKKSDIIETESWGYQSNPYLNQVIEIDTTFDPFSLLELLEAIEIELGRKEKTKIIDQQPQYKDRTIDLDIIYYGSLVINSDRLQIPHSRIDERPELLQLIVNIRNNQHSKRET